MTDLPVFGVTEPQDPADDESDDEEPSTQWRECVGCGQRGRDVRSRLGQDVEVCPDCFADREGLR